LKFHSLRIISDLLPGLLKVFVQLLINLSTFFLSLPRKSK
jgi:hypothetical protein